LAYRLDAHTEVFCVTGIRSQKVSLTGNLSGSIGIDTAQDLLNKLNVASKIKYNFRCVIV
jgi:hypothetical protein